jgi:hypothetical protein
MVHGWQQEPTALEEMVAVGMQESTRPERLEMLTLVVAVALPRLQLQTLTQVVRVARVLS